MQTKPGGDEDGGKKKDQMLEDTDVVVVGWGEEEGMGGEVGEWVLWRHGVVEEGLRMEIGWVEVEWMVEEGR